MVEERNDARAEFPTLNASAHDTDWPASRKPRAVTAWFIPNLGLADVRLGGGPGMARRSVLASKVESEVQLLQRHVTMLKAIVENQPIGIIRLSEMLKYPQHKVRYSLRILEQEGLIKPSPDGAVTTDKLEAFLMYLKGMLDEVADTVQALRKTIT